LSPFITLNPISAYFQELRLNWNLYNEENLDIWDVMETSGWSYLDGLRKLSILCSAKGRPDSQLRSTNIRKRLIGMQVKQLDNLDLGISVRQLHTELVTFTDVFHQLPCITDLVQFLLAIGGSRCRYTVVIRADIWENGVRDHCRLITEMIKDSLEVELEKMLWREAGEPTEVGWRKLDRKVSIGCRRGSVNSAVYEGK
jgi:hypothetical protein